jgi:hypothetical protein
VTSRLCFANFLVGRTEDAMLIAFRVFGVVLSPVVLKSSSAREWAVKTVLNCDSYNYKIQKKKKKGWNEPLDSLAMWILATQP